MPDKRASLDSFTNRGRQQYKKMSFEQRAEVRRQYTARIPRWRYPLVGYFVSLVLVAGMTVGMLWLRLAIGEFRFPGTLLSLVVLVVALFWGVGPALFSIILCTFVIDFFFIPPFDQLTLLSWDGMIQLLPFIFSGLTIALITAQRERARLLAIATEQELQAYATELEALNRQLEDANQIKDRFLSIASHELKTPITTIRGQAQLMLRRFSKQNGQAGAIDGMDTALERINDQAGRLTMLIDELLDVSSIRAGKIALRKQQCNIRDICCEVIEDQRFLTGRRIDFHTPATPVMIEADKDRLSQVLVNLISNAVKYSPDSSPIDVNLSQQDDKILLKIHDHGKGIAPDQQKRIFETFYRTPEAQTSSKKGLGLGLAISKEIVERHEGCIWCESEPDKGSTFFVQLPVK